MALLAGEPGRKAGRGKSPADVDLHFLTEIEAKGVQGQRGGQGLRGPAIAGSTTPRRLPSSPQRRHRLKLVAQEEREAEQRRSWKTSRGTTERISTRRSLRGNQRDHTAND